MDTLDYKIGMLKKQKVYQMTGKKFVSLYAFDKPNLAGILKEKLSKYIRFYLDGNIKTTKEVL